MVTKQRRSVEECARVLLIHALAVFGLVCLAAAPVHAQSLPHNIPDFTLDNSRPTIRSTQSGEWSSAATWVGGQVPTANNIVHVDPGHTVTISTTTAAANTIAVHGTLRFNPSVNTLLTVTNLMVMGDHGMPSMSTVGYLEVGTASAPIDAAVTAEIVIANTPIGTGVADPEQFGTGLLNFGKMTMHGSVKTPTWLRVATEPRAGHTTLSLPQAVSGWRPGDRLVLPDTRHIKESEANGWENLQNQWEERTIQSISADGRTVTLTAALQFDHFGARDLNGVLDFLPHVGNITRNVVVRSQSASGTRGHTISVHQAETDIRYAAFRDLGRTKFTPLNTTTNAIGRYPIHMHHNRGPSQTPANGYQFTLVGNAVDGGSVETQFKWGIAIHNSHYGLIQDNVVYNYNGASIATEDGSESFNVFDHNFALRGMGEPTNSVSEARMAMGTEGVGFWFRGPNNYVRNNVAANFQNETTEAAYGFVYQLIMLGNIRVPNFKGADTSVTGQYTTRNSHALPVLQFENNEAYGAMQGGFTIWWVGSEDPQPAAGNQESVIKNLSIWHTYNKTVYVYPHAKLTFDGLKIRGNHSAASRCCGDGLFYGDYATTTSVVRNSDIQGMSSGISTATSGFGPGPNVVIENTYLRNWWNLGVPRASSVNGCWMNNMMTHVVNTTFAAPPGRSLNAIEMDTKFFGNNCTSKLQEVRVYAYNGNPTDHFQVYHTDAGALPRPPASCTPTTRPGIDGLICPIAALGTPVPTATFSASPLTVGPGQSSTLTWSTGGATSVNINQGIGTVATTGTRSVSPTTTTTYTLTATNAAGSTTATATVTVTPLPTATLSASPTTIGSGQSSTLSWTTTGATSVSINQGVGTVSASGTRSVSPSTTTTYTLTATNAGGSVTATATVTLTPSTPLPTATLSASPTTIASGLSTTLTWSTTGATAVSINQGIGTVSATGTRSASPTATTTYTLTATNSAGSVTATATVTVTARLTVDRTALRFAATAGTPERTPAQTLTLGRTGPAGTLSWTASTNVTWLQLSPPSGSGAAALTVSLNPSDPAMQNLGTYNGTITVAATASNSVTINVIFQVVPYGTTVAPFGQVDTPVQNANGVQGAIGVTGWTLDDIGVSSVQIFRNCLPLDAPASCRNILGHNVVFVGDANFVPGARTDLEGAFSTYPLNYRGGWGYLMLTNMLPNVTAGLAFGGQGSLTIYAFATDMEGKRRLLGREWNGAQSSTPTSITMSNSTIAKPFGAIDTPGQGQTVSGVLANFGWALTPDSNNIADATDILVPTNGSTMHVVIDGASVGTVAYNQCRGTVGNPVPGGVFCNDDVSNIFGNLTPQPALQNRSSNPVRFRNLDAGRAPIGAFDINTTSMTNGRHSLAWGVTDSAGRPEGIGSRDFIVLNGAGSRGLTAADFENAPAAVVGAVADLADVPIASDEVLGRTGFDFSRGLERVGADTAGARQVTIPELGRLELWLGESYTTGYVKTNGTLRPLPPGSRLDQSLGRFTWSPLVGYIGPYELVFANGDTQLPVTVTIVPKTQPTSGLMRGHIDGPATSSTVSGAFTVAGWAMDLGAWQGSGVGAVHVWARRVDVAAALPVFVGAAELGVERPDVAEAFGPGGARSGWHLSAAGLSPGAYELTVYFWSNRTERFEDARTVVITVR